MGIKIDNAIAYARAIANTNHGYSQINRWAGQGNSDVKITSALFKSIPKTGDFDCSSLVISAYQYAGVDVFKNGATFTGNMLSAFVKSGFADVTSKVNKATGVGMIAGDVLLNVECHTAMYIGDGKLVQASISETGGITGVAGDQTGNEINTRSYYNYPWDYVLRYAKDTAEPTYTYMYATAEGLDYRKGPKQSAKVKGEMRLGERVKALNGSNKTADGCEWVKTSYNNWIKKKYLSTTKVKVFAVGDKVTITSDYASSAYASTATANSQVGSTVYIVKLYEGANYPYQLGTRKGNTSGTYTIGFANKSAIKK